VARDFREELGMRDVLNLGHTYGHVVESHHGPSVSHGRAVALGLAVALQYSRDRHGFPPDAAEAAASVCLELAGGEFPEAPPEVEVRRLLAFDKKIRGGSLKFVALSAPGRPVVDRIGPDEILAAAAKVGRRG
jgi:3-dehydroquinate synthetase